MSEIADNAARALWRSAERVGVGKPAIVQRAESVEYPELRLRAAAVAEALAHDGVRPGDRVAVFLEPGAAAAAAYYGVMACGGAAVLVNEGLRPRQIEYILEHSGAHTLLADDVLLERMPRPLEASCAILRSSEVPDVGEWDPVPRTGGDLAQIIYTSGSTGPPKGVAISHGNLQAGVASVVRYLGLRSDDRLAGLLPFSFDYGLNQLLCAVEIGATLVVERSPLPQRVARTIREAEVTVLAAVPPLWHQLLTVPDFTAEPCAPLRILTNTGGHLPKEAVERLRSSHPQAALYLMYGLTEAFRSTYLTPEETDRRPGSIGHAIPGAEVLVLREDGTECDPGEPGELVHRGPTVALGYWNDPEATARRFRPNPLRPEGTPDAERVVFSGDLVRRDEEGFLYFVGRRDRMIKSLGFRISPDEVASVLHASGQVVEVMVGSEPHPVRGEAIVAYVVLTATGSEEALRTFAGIELPRHMQPMRYDVRESLPRTASGKHDPQAVVEAPGTASG